MRVVVLAYPSSSYTSLLSILPGASTLSLVTGISL